MITQIKENRLQRLRTKAGQHMMEVLLLFLAVAVGFVLTRTYLKRAVFAKLKHMEIQLNEAVRFSGGAYRSVRLFTCMFIDNPCIQSGPGGCQMCVHGPVTPGILYAITLPLLGNEEYDAFFAGTFSISVAEWITRTGLTSGLRCPDLNQNYCTFSYDNGSCTPACNVAEGCPTSLHYAPQIVTGTCPRTTITLY